MRARRPATFLAVLAITLFAAVGQVRADLYALTGDFHRRGMAHYDAAGRLVQTVPAGIESADGLTISSDGWVYVAGNGIGQGFLTRARVGGPYDWQNTQPSPSPLYNVPMGLAAGPDGSVYATSTRFREGGLTGALRYDADDGTLAPAVTAEDTGQPFANLTYAVALSPAGDIHLGRHGIGVERYTPAGQLVGLVVPAAAITGFSEDIAFGPDGNLYVPHGAGVDRYHPQTGALIDRFIANGAGGLNGAADLDFGGDGLLYVNSPAARSVLRYDAVTGAFHDVFVAPAQYESVPGGELRQIVYVVPEPAALAPLAAAASILALRHRGTGRSSPVRV